MSLFETVNRPPTGGSGPITTAAPGEVQAAIDDLAGTGGTVQLDPGEDYGSDPDLPYQVRKDVWLDYAGTIIDLSQDTDILHVHPGGKVVNPTHNLRSVAYSSTVITLDTAFNGAYKSWHNTLVDGGKTYGNGGEGTGIYLHNSATSMVFTRVFHDINGIDKALDVHSEGSFINSNQVGGIFHNYRIAVHERGTGTVEANLWGPQHWQPNSTYAEHGRVTDTGNYNLCWGWFWDSNNYTAGTSTGASDQWEINGGGNYNGMMAVSSIGHNRVTDNRGSGFYFIDEMGHSHFFPRLDDDTAADAGMLFYDTADERVEYQLPFGGELVSVTGSGDGARGYLSSTQSVAGDGNFDIVRNDATTFEDSGVASLDTGTGKVTVSSSGRYLIRGRTRFNGVPDGTKLLANLESESTGYLAYDFREKGTGGSTTQHVSVETVAGLGENETLVFNVAQDSGGSLNLQNDGRNTYFEVIRL